MSTCSNCYNGCTEIVSDRCIKYTGIDVPVLGIQTGDSLSFVEQALITFLTATINGTGIKPIIDNTILCTIIKQYLPTCGDITLNDILSAVIKATCNLQQQILIVSQNLEELNADYTIGCLTGVTPSSNTHDIVQAVITKLCLVNSNLGALALELQNQYSSNGVELDNYISNYLATHSSSVNLVSNRMVPFSVVPYFGPLSNFSSTGVGLGDWDRIFLCNGLNGTPDTRGRVLVGVTAVPGGGAYPSQTDPALGNPNYTLNVPLGANGVALSIGQMPQHAHPNTTAVTIISPNPHTHAISPQVPFVSGKVTPTGTGSTGSTTPVNTTLTSADVNLTAATTVTVADQGAGQSHPNFQPGLGCYYIMYIPAP